MSGWISASIIFGVPALIVILGLLDAKHRWAARWAERAEERAAAEPGAGRHRPTAQRATLSALRQRWANEAERAHRGALERLERTHLLSWSELPTGEFAPVVSLRT